MEQLVPMLFPVLAVIAGRFLYEGIQIVAGFVNSKLTTQVHAIALIAIQFGLLQFAQWIGMTLPTALTGFTQEMSTAVVSALIAMGWHAVSKSSASK